MPDEPIKAAEWLLPKLLKDLPDAKLLPLKLAHLKHQQALCNLPLFVLNIATNHQCNPISGYEIPPRWSQIKYPIYLWILERIPSCHNMSQSWTAMGIRWHEAPSLQITRVNLSRAIPKSRAIFARCILVGFHIFLWSAIITFTPQSQKLSCQGDACAPATMWAAVELAIQRQELFDEDRAGANALCRGKGRKKKDAGEARYIPILMKKTGSDQTSLIFQHQRKNTKG